MRAYADALESVPLALAENSGFSPVTTLSAVKVNHVEECRGIYRATPPDPRKDTLLSLHCSQAAQIAQKNPYLGVDCLQKGTMDMKKQRVCTGASAN